MTNLPKANQYIKTKKGTVAWGVWFVDADSIALQHARNGNGRRISHAQFFKNWEIIGA